MRVNVLSGIERHLNNDAMHRGVIIEFSDMLQQLRLTRVPGQLHTPGTDTYLLSCLDLHLDVHIAVLSSTNLAEDDMTPSSSSSSSSLTLTCTWTMTRPGVKSGHSRLMLSTWFFRLVLISADTSVPDNTHPPAFILMIDALSSQLSESTGFSCCRGLTINNSRV